jgi:tripartite-type tricarboxylate transporter receptor subunit TctC
MDSPILGDAMPIRSMKRRTFIAALSGVATVALQCIAGAMAQVYPSHPVTMIVPFPPGGPSDNLARILAERMRISLGQPVVIENVSGAGASIGVARLARAVPDGYTIGIGNMTAMLEPPRSFRSRTTF